MVCFGDGGMVWRLWRELRQGVADEGIKGEDKLGEGRNAGTYVRRGGKIQDCGESRKEGRRKSGILWTMEVLKGHWRYRRREGGMIRAYKCLIDGGECRNPRNVGMFSGAKIGEASLREAGDKSSFNHHFAFFFVPK